MVQIKGFTKAFYPFIPELFNKKLWKTYLCVMMSLLTDRIKGKAAWHHSIFIFLLLLFAVFLPTSKYMASLMQFLIAIHWVIRGDFALKWQRLRSNYALWVLLLLYLAHVAGMLFTTNYDYGFHDLKIKVPLLLIPIIFASSEQLSAKEVKLILLFFAAAVFASSLVTLGGILEWIPAVSSNFRDASLFISHIRFALLVDLAIFILSFYFLRPNSTRLEKFVYGAGIVYFLVFLVASKAMTGIVVACIVGVFLSLRWIIYHTNQLVRWFTLVAVVTIPVLISSYINAQFSSFYTLLDDRDNLDEQTINGNPYWHDSTNYHLENGHYVGIYLCEPELQEGWKKLSDYAYWGEDDRGHQLKYTLMRYLASKGLRKDGYGVSQLDTVDVRLIESGYANVRYKSGYSISTRVYELIWQIDVYRKGGNPSGHSMTQRMEYLKTAWAIFIDHPWFGVGTGDVPIAFDQKYAQLKSQLDPEWRLRAHNQWLTFGVALGIIGFVICACAIILPGLLLKRFRQYLFLLFFLVACISMFNEDTLETQAGVALFAFFYPLFLFLVPDEKEL